MLKAWNLLLIVLTFSLTLLGTFLIRSGVISSVHAFGDGPVGPFFLTFFVIVSLVSLTLVALRWDQVRDRAELDAVVSREGAFLGVNVLMLALTFAVLIGTTFPLLVEATQGARVTVGAPFFDQTSLPLWMLVLLLMGIGPLLPWRKAESQSLRRNLAIMTLALAAATALALLLGMRKVYPLVTVGLAGWNLASLGLLIAGAVVPRARLTGRSLSSVFTAYAFENRRRFGSMVVHFGVVVVALGITGASGYRMDQQLRLEYGTPTTFQGYDLVARQPFAEQVAGRRSVGVLVDVFQGDRRVATLNPRINAFGDSQMNVPTPSVRYTLTHDLYLALAGAVSPDADAVVIRAVQSPLVALIWVGGLVMALGTAYALSPAPERSRRRVTEAAGGATDGTAAGAEP